MLKQKQPDSFAAYVKRHPPETPSVLGQGSVPLDSVVSFGAAARADGSIVLAGWTDGDWFGERTGFADAAAVALDEDGVELWRWQVKVMHVLISHVELHVFPPRRRRKRDWVEVLF